VNQKQHLDWWQTQMGGRDLRLGRRGAVTVVDLEKALDGTPSRRQRIAVIKALYAHLRRTHRIATAENRPSASSPSYPRAVLRTRSTRATSTRRSATSTSSG